MRRIACRDPRAGGARTRDARGYTAVELLTSMAVFAVGIIGVIAGQKVTIASNLHAKNLALATHIGQAWLGMLEAEASQWLADGSSTGLLTAAPWINQGTGQTDWFRPDYDATRLFGPAFDALGNPVRDEDHDPDARFCVDLRFSRLNTAEEGTGLTRVEVRVIWLRDNAIITGSLAAPTHACSIAAANVDDTAERRLFHFVFLSGAVRQVGSI